MPAVTDTHFSVTDRHPAGMDTLTRSQGASGSLPRWREVTWLRIQKKEIAVISNMDFGRERNRALRSTALVLGCVQQAA